MVWLLIHGRITDIGVHPSRYASTTPILSLNCTNNVSNFIDLQTKCPPGILININTKVVQIMSYIIIITLNN